MKELLAKVYTPGGNYITTWTDWTSDPVFRWPINGGPGALEFELPRRWGVSGEPNEPGPNRSYDELDYDDGTYDSIVPAGLGDLMLDNIVRLYVSDREAANLLIYQGRIAEYEHDLLNGVVNGTLVPFTAEVADRYVVERLQLTGDPTNVVEAIVNSYLPNITFDTLSPQVGIELPFIFEKQKINQMLDILQQAAGEDWAWRINPDNSLTFEPHDFFDPIRLTIGKEIAGNVKLSKSAIQRRRRVYVYGKQTANFFGFVIETEQIVGIAADPDYDPDIYPLDLVVANERIEDVATATRIANALLQSFSKVTIGSEAIIADSNFDEKGFDIESLRPGMQIQMLHPDQQYYFPKIGDHIVGDGHIIGGPWWAQVLRPVTIAEVEYHFSYARVKLQNVHARVASELSSLSDRLLLAETAT